MKTCRAFGYMISRERGALITRSSITITVTRLLILCLWTGGTRACGLLVLVIFQGIVILPKNIFLFWGGGNDSYIMWVLEKRMKEGYDRERGLHI